MLSLIAVSSLETLVENNLALFAIGHIALVLILLVVFFNWSSDKAPKESSIRDEEAFDYGTEDGSLFKSNMEGSIPLNALNNEDEDEDQNPNSIDDPIVFNSQINDDNLPGEETQSVEEEAQDIEAEEAKEDDDDTNAVAAALTAVGDSEKEEQDTESRRQEKIQEILAAHTSQKLLLINRDETIIDINAHASEILQYQKDDIEGKKIDEIIFLEESQEERSESETEGYQKAKAERKDGSHFPIQVELEMADREFGIIMVSLHPAVFEEDDEEPLEETPVEPEPEPEADVAPEPKETVVPEPEPEPVKETAPPVKKPLPPPPRPKTPTNALALNAGGAMVPGGHRLDSKSIEMFSSQLSQPLQSIAQLAQLIASDENAIPHLKKYAVAIQAKSNRIMSQIEEMSMLVSAQKTDVKIDEKPLNLGNLLESLVKLTSNIPGENPQKIHYDRGQNDLIVLSDEVHLEKVISNLINMAMNSAENQDIELHLESNVIKDAKSPAKTVDFKGQKMEINTIRCLKISTQFPSDENTNRFFDVSINRPDNPLVQKLQSSSSLKNHMASIRLMKELAGSLGGKLKFSSNEQQIGELLLEVNLPSVEVAAYPS